MNISLPKSWQSILQNPLTKANLNNIFKFLNTEYQRTTIYPQKEEIFAALEKTPFEKISVIILGQDPYHNENQAHGFAFSVPYGQKTPPSLKNIYKEISSDLNKKKDLSNGNLSNWVEQGVLLLNTILTVEKNKPGSHRNKGWEEFTNQIIQKISNEKNNCVFLLWGKYAQQKISLIDQRKHLVLSSAHPSPFSAHLGFNGNKHFSQTNSYLKKHKKKEIDW